MATLQTKPQELHRAVVNPQVAAQVVTVLLNLNNTTTADITFQGFKAPRRMKLVRATYQQTADATAVTSYTCQLKNGSTNLTSALDIKAIAANSGADFAGVPVGDTAILADGDVLTVVFDETGGTVTAPGVVGIMLDFLLLE